MEQELGIALFERTLQGLKPTDTALRLYEPVAGAGRALSEAALMAEGSSAALGGTVRITASSVISHYVLPLMLASLREAYPAIAVELVPADSAENLLLREADIAVCMFRPTQLELITKKLGTIPLVCCAHQSYLARRGIPTEHRRPGAIARPRRLRPAPTLMLAARAAAGAFDIEPGRHPQVCTDSQTGMWEMLKAGLGIGFAQAPLVAAAPGMVPLLPGLPFRRSRSG